MKNSKLFGLMIVAILFLCSSNVCAQIGGYIIKVNDDKVYLNLPNVKVSDIVSVFDNGGYATDPRTGREKEVGQIKIITVRGDYAIGKVYGNTKTTLAESMTVRKRNTLPTNGYGKVTVLIAPLEVKWSDNYKVGDGTFEEIVPALLMKHLLKSDKIQLLDRSVMEAYQPVTDNENQQKKGIYEKEMDLAQNIDPNTAIESGKIVGARYVVKIIMQKPDVVNVSNNIPFKKLINTAKNISNYRQQSSFGANNIVDQLPTDVQTKKIKVSVTLTVRVVDLQTNVLLFQCSETSKAEGTPQVQISWESNDLNNESSSLDSSENESLNNTSTSGNVILNRKDVDFTQTVTGKAINNAFEKIGKELNKFFEGKISK